MDGEGRFYFVTIRLAARGVHRSLSGLASGYLADDCQLVTDARARLLRSADTDCPNKNVFSLNREYDNSAFRMSASKLFHTLVAEAAKVLSPKQLEVRTWTDSVFVSAERSSLARASVTS